MCTKPNNFEGNAKISDTIIYLKTLRKFQNEFNLSERQVIKLINLYKILLLIDSKEFNNAKGCIETGTNIFLTT